MGHGKKIGLCLAGALLFSSMMATAAEEEHGRGGGAPRAAAPAARPAAPRGEAHPGPSGYGRVREPEGWNKRPEAAGFNRDNYRHNFQAARAFHIGPYHRPAGWAAHHWGFGQILPRAYWGSEYLVSDYWLFALEVPPAGYEWVRDDDDALLVNVDTGEILQAEYGVFA